MYELQDKGERIWPRLKAAPATRHTSIASFVTVVTTCAAATEPNDTVSGGQTREAIWKSSKPITDTSPGADSPAGTVADRHLRADYLDPAALAADPMLVKRLRRMRASRQRQRSARRLGLTL